MKNYLILIGLVLIVLFVAVAGPINTAIAGLIIGSSLLLFLVICMLQFIIEDEGREGAIIILGLSIAGLIVLWTVVARHPSLYPHLKSMGIL